MKHLLALWLLLSSPMAGQLVYDGPIVDRPGRYDGYPVHLEEDGTHHLWFCGESTVTNRDAIFHSQKSGSLRETTGWSQATELLNINDVAWAKSGGGVHVCDPTVIQGKFLYQGIDYRFAMYFTADTTNLQAGDNAIGVAFSNDATSWIVHDQPVVQPDGGYDGSYGAGAGGVAWGLEANVIHHAYRDSTTSLGTDWRIRYKSSIDGLSFGPMISLDTRLSDASLSNLGSAPEIAFFAPQNRWFAAIQEVAGGDQFTGRILRSDSDNQLFDTWSTIVGLDQTLSNEELLILPSVAKNANSTLLVDDEGWLYTFFTTGNNRGSGPGIDSWKIGQARFRLFETSGSYVEDSFNNIGHDRLIGQPLHSTASESGAKIWSANPAWILGQGFATIDSTVAGTARASIPFESTIGGRTTVRARVDPQGADWLAVGLSSASGAGLFGGELWIQLNPNNRRAHAFANGTNHLLGSVLRVNVEAPVELRITYEAQANVVSAWVNNTSIVDRASLSHLGFTPDLHRAGIHTMYRKDSTPKILDIQINEIATTFEDGFESGSVAAWTNHVGLTTP